MYPMDEAIVRAFIAPHRRARWLLSLASARRRPSFLDCLNHCIDLDPRFVRWLPSNADVLGLLRSHGAPATCYVLSCTDSLDGREMPLEAALSEVPIGGWGTIVSCIPGRLAYYYDECGKRRALLARDEDS